MIYPSTYRRHHAVVTLIIVPNINLVQQAIRSIEKSYERHPDQDGTVETVVTHTIRNIKHLFQLLTEYEDHQQTEPTYHFWVTNILIHL